MSDDIIDLGSGFHSIRGDFRIGGVLNVGTQCSLVEFEPGRFVFLDSYTLPDAVREEVDRMTDRGEKIEAILNLHPFHTLHCEWMHDTFPEAKLFGTARHKRKMPDLPWQDTLCESDDLSKHFGAWFEFSVPDGVPLVCEDESVHFSSVLAFHKASGVIHVDDTFTYLRKGFPLSVLPMTGRMDFHPTLAKALLPEAGAADAFREWAIDLGIRWHEAKIVAAAHNAILHLEPEQFPKLVGDALGRVKKVLDKHRAEHG